MAVGPQDPVVDLVPHLDHVGQGSLLLQGEQHADGVCPYRILQRFEIKGCPCFRLVLLLRVGPVVAVMKIEQQFHPGVPDPLCHGEGLI